MRKIFGYIAFFSGLFLFIFALSINHESIGFTVAICLGIPGIILLMLGIFLALFKKVPNDS
jgi:hypothetical protein